MACVMKRGTLFSSRCLLQTFAIIVSLLVLTQVLFLHNKTTQIFPRIFLPNSYTYIDRSSVIYQNDNKVLLLTEKVLRKPQNKTVLMKTGKKKDNKTKSEQYVIYKFNASQSGYELKDFVQKSILFQRVGEKSSFYNGNLSIHNPNPMSYHTVFGSPIYITSAHGRFGAEPENMTFYNGSYNHLLSSTNSPNTYFNSSGDRPVSFISMTGWMHDSLLHEDLYCCLLLKNQSVISYLNRRRMLWYQVKKQPLLATKTYCPIPQKLQAERPMGASLSLPPYGCYIRIFMKVHYPAPQKRGSLAFCSKIAYGSFPADRLLEWLEIQKFTGVDRIMIYYYNLNSAAMRVLNKYMEEGFVDLQPFDYPQPDDPKRQVGEKEAQPFIDEQVAVYDCIERLKSFNYIGIIDFDEIVYAKMTHKHNVKALLRYLHYRYPDASGFRFMTELFLSDWYNGTASTGTSDPTQTDPGNQLWHSQFVNRTAPMVDRVKSIINTERVVLDSIWTHNYTSLPGYKRYTISTKLGCVKHFRSCREKWVEEGKCSKLRKYKDYTISNLTQNVKNIIHGKKKAILGL